MASLTATTELSPVSSHRYSMIVLIDWQTLCLLWQFFTNPDQGTPSPKHQFATHENVRTVYVFNNEKNDGEDAVQNSSCHFRCCCYFPPHYSGKQPLAVLTTFIRVFFPGNEMSLPVESKTNPFQCLSVSYAGRLQSVGNFNLFFLSFRF
jgi:hypothetical protein